ncbi:hypothetical protein MO973_23405 [Paenibacillus sp. TRM 82003]|nr:hypothetical protein [Paenibacillus sp. TRM 82003]
MSEEWNAPESAPPGDAPKKRNAKHVWLGFGIVIVLHLIWFVYVPMFIIIGISQLIYVIPLAIYYGIKKNRSMLQGILLGALVTFLLNAACFGIVLYQFSFGP